MLSPPFKVAQRILYTEMLYIEVLLRAYLSLLAGT